MLENNCLISTSQHVSKLRYILSDLHFGKSLECNNIYKLCLLTMPIDMPTLTNHENERNSPH